MASKAKLKHCVVVSICQSLFSFLFAAATTATWWCAHKSASVATFNLLVGHKRARSSVHEEKPTATQSTRLLLRWKNHLKCFFIQFEHNVNELSRALVSPSHRPKPRPTKSISCKQSFAVDGPHFHFWLCIVGSVFLNPLTGLRHEDDAKLSSQMRNINSSELPLRKEGVETDIHMNWWSHSHCQTSCKGIVWICCGHAHRERTTWSFIGEKCASRATGKYRCTSYAHIIQPDCRFRYISCILSSYGNASPTEEKPIPPHKLRKTMLELSEWEDNSQRNGCARASLYTSRFRV